MDARSIISGSLADPRLRWAGGGAAVAVLLALVLVLLSGEEDDVLEAPVAAVAVAPLPDFTVYTDVREKKQRFFDYLLPIIKSRNDWIRAQRAFLVGVSGRFGTGTPLPEADRRRIEQLARRYRVKLDGGVNREVVDRLLRRVDVIPASLALAQAASESAWGASRFARAGNNLFGEWCFTVGCGLVPRSRPAGATHEVEVFDTPADSVASYFRNLNSHPAYREVRELRARARREGRPITGAELAEGLEKYSERGQDYIEDLRAIIRVNDLDAFDIPVRLAQAD